MASHRETIANGVDRYSINPVLERDQSQWLFTDAELLRTPSIVEGLEPQQELANRQKGVNFITQVGIMLKLPQLTLATASVYLHRFFMRHAMQQSNKPGLHHYSVAATALFLATKVEENCRKMKELVVACCRVAQKQPNLVVDEQNKEYWKWRDTILHNEDLLLEALCFDLQLEQPYRILFTFLQYYGVQDEKNLRNTSWAFLNDSHITPLCLLHSPRVIAGAALFAGIRFAALTLPDDENGRPWWDHLGLDILEIQRACNLMFEVYENPHVPRVGQKEVYTREDDMVMFDKTRQYLSPRPDFSPGGGNSIRSTSQGTKRDRDDLDGEGSEEWGAAAPNSSEKSQPEAPPSPKRQRRGSAESTNSRVPPPPPPPPPPLSRVPSAASGSRVPAPPPSDIDDVQARIDDIVNRSSSATGDRPTEQQPALPRRSSSQQKQQQWSGPPPRRSSDAMSIEPRPPSSNNNTRILQNGGNVQEKEITMVEQKPVSQEIDVDYGSEEGEL